MRLASSHVWRELFCGKLHPLVSLPSPPVKNQSANHKSQGENVGKNLGLRRSTLPFAPNHSAAWNPDAFLDCNTLTIFGLNGCHRAAKYLKARPGLTWLMPTVRMVCHDGSIAPSFENYRQLKISSITSYILFAWSSQSLMGVLRH